MFFSFVYLFWMDPDLDPPSIIMSSLISSSLNNLFRNNSTINSKIWSKITMKNFKNLKYLKYLLTVIKQFYILVYAWVSYPSPRFLQVFTISPPPAHVKDFWSVSVLYSCTRNKNSPCYFGVHRLQHPEFIISVLLPYFYGC